MFRCYSGYKGFKGFEARHRKKEPNLLPYNLPGASLSLEAVGSDPRSAWHEAPANWGLAVFAFEVEVKPRRVK